MVLVKAAPSESQRLLAPRLSPQLTRSRDKTAVVSLQEENQRTAALATVHQVVEGLRSATDRLQAPANPEPAAWGAFPIHRIEIPGEGKKYVYPLRGCVSVLLKGDGEQVEARIRELDSIVSLRGRGKDVLAAMRDLFWQFHLVVEEYWWVPPHDRIESNERVRRVLAHLIDWDRYASENPVEQPLWGRIDANRPDGGLQVRWFLGPDSDRGEYDALLAASDLHPALRSMRAGEWFLGGVRRYLDRLEWTAAPEVVPDPRDKDGRRAAWDRVPAVVMDDPDAWPARQGE